MSFRMHILWWGCLCFCTNSTEMDVWYNGKQIKEECITTNNRKSPFLNWYTRYMQQEDMHLSWVWRVKCERICSRQPSHSFKDVTDYSCCPGGILQQVHIENKCKKINVVARYFCKKMLLFILLMSFHLLISKYQLILAIWQHRTGSNVVQVMAYCLRTPIRHLN